MNDSTIEQLQHELEQHKHELELVHRAGILLTRALDVNTINRALHEIITEMMKCDTLIISGYDASTQLITALFIFHDGEILDISQFPPIPFNPNAPDEQGGTQKQAIRTGESLILNDYVAYLAAESTYYYKDGEVRAADEMEATEEDDEDAETARSALIIPMKLDDQITGVVQVMSYNLNAYTTDHLRFLEAIAPQAAIAVKNARLVANLEIMVEQRTAELLSANEQTEAILHSATDGIVLLLDKGTDHAVSDHALSDRAIINRANQSFLEMLGYSAAEITNLPLSQFIDGDVIPHPLTAVTLECEMVRRDQTRFTAQLHFTPLTIHVRDQWVCTVVDITQHKRLEHELRQALEKERQLGETRMQLLSTVSHELRTPLASIMLSSETLRDHHERLSPEKRRSYLDHIHDMVKVLNTVIEDAFTVARADVVGLEARRTEVNMIEFCSGICEDMNQLSQRDAVAFSTSGTPVPASIDKTLMTQVLINLLSNAIKYSQAGTPLPELKLLFKQREMVLRVVDHGIGIPKHELENLFNAFYRASNVGLIRGTGLGLAVVKRAVDAHAGSVEITSELNKGTIVTIHLPFTP